MLRLKQLLIDYVKNTEQAETNLELAIEYFKVRHYAAALSFFLRAAERTNNVEMQYFSLLKVGKCLEIAGNRLHTVRAVYQHCINILPNRPEAYYYLSRIYEWQEDWTTCYTIANQGLRHGIADNKMQYQELLDYPGKYALLFQKALSAWWWGKNDESRDILQDLSTNYRNKLSPEFKYTIQNNMARIVSPADSAPSLKRYHKIHHYDRFKFRFDNLNLVEESYAQIYQDLFILSALNGKKGGTYLEIGSGHPVLCNNTYLLESVFDWTGCAVEINSKYVEAYKAKRKNQVICDNALNIDYSELIKSNITTSSNIIDYLQLDCEPAEVTYKILLKMPLNDYKFRVITYEHDYYADVDKIYREKSRLYLANNGYILVVNDLCSDYNKRFSFEDWWVHKDLIDKDTLNKLLSCNLETNTDPDEYFGFR